jgi:hypothetical protein
MNYDALDRMRFKHALKKQDSPFVSEPMQEDADTVLLRDVRSQFL